MTDVHRRFLQLLMTHGVLEERGVRRLQKHCYRVHGREYRLPVPRVPGTAPSRLVTRVRASPPVRQHASPGRAGLLGLAPARFSPPL